MFNFLIKANHESESKKTELLLKNEDIIYALSSTSRIDFQALKIFTKQNNFTEPELKNEKSPIKRNYFQIRNPKRKFPWQTPKRMHSKELGILAENRNFSKKAIIIPVDVFWGKSPERQDNWLKLLFRESWEGTSFIRNLFKLFFYIRSFLSSPRAKRAGWPKARALASLARLLLDFIHPPPPLAQLGTTLKVVRASFWAVRRSKCILRG